VSTEAVGAVLIAICLPLVMAGLAKLFPARPATTVSTLPLEDLRAHYASWETGLGLSGLAACAPVGYARWLGLRALSAAHARLTPPAEVVWFAQPLYWIVPSGLLAFSLAFYLSDWAGRRFLRERYPEYLDYLQLKTKMDMGRVSSLLKNGALVASAVSIFLGLAWSLRLESDGLVFHRYFSLRDERFAVSDIQSIRTAPALIAPSGGLVVRREYVLQFADGRRWTTNDLLADPSEMEKRKLVALLALRSGVPVQEVAVFHYEEL
jgi:hypothetical protein